MLYLLKVNCNTIKLTEHTPCYFVIMYSLFKYQMMSDLFKVAR